MEKSVIVLISVNHVTLCVIGGVCDLGCGSIKPWCWVDVDVLSSQCCVDLVDQLKRLE